MNDEIIIKNDLTVEEYNYLREDVNWNKKNPDFIKMAIENSTIVKKAMLNVQLLEWLELLEMVKIICL